MGAKLVHELREVVVVLDEVVLVELGAALDVFDGFEVLDDGVLDTVVLGDGLLERVLVLDVGVLDVPVTELALDPVLLGVSVLDAPVASGFSAWAASWQPAITAKAAVNPMPAARLRGATAVWMSASNEGGGMASPSSPPRRAGEASAGFICCSVVAVWTVMGVAS